MTEAGARPQGVAREAVLWMFLFIVSVCAASGAAAADYPSRPIRMVVPWPAGGPTDAVARVLAHQMSERLGQQGVVDNKGGATRASGRGSGPQAPPGGDTRVVRRAANPGPAQIGKHTASCAPRP